MLSRLILFALLFGLLSGCQSLSERRQSELLVDTLRKYEATLRWGAMQQAQSFASAEDLSKFSPTRSKDLRIIHYEVIQGPTRLSGDKAVQAVLIQYVRESSQNVRELLDQQVWGYDAQTEHWTRQSPLPVFQ